MKYYNVNKNVDLYKTELHTKGGTIIWYLKREEIADLIDAHRNQIKENLFVWYSNSSFNAELTEDGVSKDCFYVNKKSIILRDIISIDSELYVNYLDDTDITKPFPYN